MVIIGIIALIAGVGLAIYGNSLNNNVEAQIESLFSAGQVNPGNTWLYIGIAVGVIGLILLVVGISKSKKK